MTLSAGLFWPARHLEQYLAHSSNSIHVCDWVRHHDTWLLPTHPPVCTEFLAFEFTSHACH